MTAFLCVLALVALCASPKVEGSTTMAAFVMIGWASMVLGLATLALYSSQGRAPW